MATIATGGVWPENQGRGLALIDQESDDVIGSFAVELGQTVGRSLHRYRTPLDGSTLHTPESGRLAVLGGGTLWTIAGTSSGRCVSGRWTEMLGARRVGTPAEMHASARYSPFTAAVEERLFPSELIPYETLVIRLPDNTDRRLGAGPRGVRTNPFRGEQTDPGRSWTLDIESSPSVASRKPVC